MSNWETDRLLLSRHRDSFLPGNAIDDAGLNGLWVCGLWFVVYGWWFMVYGLWFDVCG